MTPSESHALMRRELEEQPRILAEAAERLSAHAMGFGLARGMPLFAGGCGDSLFAAQALTRHFRLNERTLRPLSAAEALWETAFGADDAFVAVSISGSTLRSVEAVRRARAAGAHTIAVTLNPDSALAAAANAALRLPYSPISRAIPHGLDYQMTLLALGALAGEIDGPALGRMLKDATPALLDEARGIAAAMPSNGRFFFLGSGAALGSAHYGAAKMHEAGGLPAWSFESENFAHGAQFMLRTGDHVVLCGSGGPGDARTAMLRGGLERLGCSVSAAALEDGTDGLAAAMRAGLAAQALCLAVAEARGLDVTEPAGGSGAAEVQSDWFGWSSD
ncbi:MULTISPECIES: SIS domain-containing protein [Limimaricola]|uniref:SIS domain-containing protein n=1 Tax=Limimaricola litoreus TaxID=2955316 RepID=A0A9X2JN50_9RHOB|nr:MULTISPECIES: SIS domain-containing protein [Limimaricola]MCP1167129.1 SIS domain-containing protein [Limimaricola litoreus]